MKGEIAATRRAAYAAEGAVAKLEKDKLEQDFRIDGLQESLKGLQQQLQLYTVQHQAQARETRAALETLAEAEADMEGVQFEKKQLVAQWRSSLLAIQKRDEALAAIQDAIRQQQMQELSLDTEISGYKRDIVKQQLANEAVTAVLKKVEAESGFISQQVEATLEKQSRLSEVLVKLTKSLDHTEQQITRLATEGKALAGEAEAVDRAFTKVVQEIRAIEEEMLVTLSNQTTSEKSSCESIEHLVACAATKTASDIRLLRKRIREEELGVVDAQNELAKLQVDVLNTEAHNARLVETLKMLDEELNDKAGAIEKYELEIKRRNDEIEKKTREIDLLNRRLERMVGNMEDEETGPLEATIKNLQREIDTKALESKEMQRRWIAAQTELVGLQNENQALSVTVTRLRAEHTVLVQRRRRLETTYEGHTREVKSLNTGMARLHVELQRVNGLIASNASAREALAEDNLQLETRIAGDLHDMEIESARLQSQIEESRQSKRDVLSEMVEVERQVMLWERKLLLEKEMREVLDPTVGQDVVGEMKKEIHRMQLRHGELMRLQEKLIADMEKALSKRDLIGLKGRATVARAKQAAPPGASAKEVSSLTRGQLDKAVQDLQRSVRDTEQELAATDARLQALEAQRSSLQAAASEADQRCSALRQQEEVVQAEIADAMASKYKLMLATSRQQKAAKRYEDMASGRHRPLVEDPAALDPELSRAGQKLDGVLAFIERVRAAVPQLGGELDKVLCHVSEV
ncbi:hypothetical protein QJQ45_012419 [Haematococcus lacustris]|nr:hypothetical protein QJQ45_012419 [Haematococcus lacustris]